MPDLSAIAKILKNLLKGLKEIFDLIPLLIRILIKGALIALIVAFTISLLKMALAYITVYLGGSWMIKYLEMFHEGFSLLIFIISCLRDLDKYLKESKRK